MTSATPLQAPILSALLTVTAALLVSAPLAAEEASSRDESPADDSGDSTTNIAIDFDFGAALHEAGNDAGGGGALRIGRQLDLFVVSLTPEIGGGYHAFNGADTTRVYGGFLGGRLAVGKLLEPSVFAHVGVGRVAGTESRTAPTLDGGLALDLTLLPLIDLGVHGAYNVVLPSKQSSALEFMTLGAHAALVL